MAFGRMRGGADHDLQECFRCTQRRWNQNGDLVAFTVENLQHNNCPRTLRSLMSTTFRCWILYCGRPKKYCYKEEMLRVSMQWSNVFYCKSNRGKRRREHEMLPCWAATSAIEKQKRQKDEGVMHTMFRNFRASLPCAQCCSAGV